MKYFLVIFSLFPAFSWQKTSSVKQFLWLEGKWQTESGDVYEKWQFVNDTMISGINYHFIEVEEEKGEMEEQLIIDEVMHIISREKKFYYTIFALSQNQGKEVEFEIISSASNSFVAVHRGKNCPQRIRYQLNDEKHLRVYFESKETGELKKTSNSFIKAE